jgi:two-component system chemotaxis response regulator CheB
VNRLFASAASSYASEGIGIILTGLLTDGTAGLQAVKQAEGTTIIQEPREAAYPSMPQSAQEHCPIDYCLAQIALLLQTLTG